MLVGFLSTFHHKSPPPIPFNEGRAPILLFQEVGYPKSAVASFAVYTSNTVCQFVISGLSQGKMLTKRSKDYAPDPD